MYPESIIIFLKGKVLPTFEFSSFSMSSRSFEIIYYDIYSGIEKRLLFLRIF